MIVEVSEKIGRLKIEPYEKIIRLNMGDFLLLSGLKNHREHRGHREKRHSSVLSVYSVVDQLCSDSFFQNKLINRLNTEGSEPIRNIFDEGELARESVVANSATTAADGKMGAEYD